MPQTRFQGDFLPDIPFDLRDLEFIPYSPAVLPRIMHSSFDCGNSELNEFLEGDVDAHSRERIAQTTLMFHANSLVGFFSLCTDAVRLGDADAEYFHVRGFPYRALPAIKIARLGIDERFKRKHLGQLAFTVIIGIASRLHQNVGCRFLTVDAKPSDEALRFWEKLGFQRILARNAQRESISYSYDLLNPSFPSDASQSG